MELHHLRYLVAVAEEQHFGRAAQKLFISQPSLSYAIKALERELGLTLLQRSPRRVELTAAGHDVVAAARRALHAATTVSRTAERHRGAQAGLLRIGFEATGASEFGTRARQRFLAHYPHARVELHRSDWGGEADALRAGTVDAAFVWLPCDDTDLTLQIVATEPRFAGVALHHRLANREHLSIDDLADEPLMTTRKAPRFWVDWWAVSPRPDGSEVRWGPETNNIEECFEHVADGAAACICPTSIIAFYQRPDIAWIPITDIEPLQIAFAHRTDDTTPVVATFAGIVADLLNEQAQPATVTSD
jgi:DNA-binding transcriptional LysR family regulator